MGATGGERTTVTKISAVLPQKKVTGDMAPVRTAAELTTAIAVRAPPSPDAKARRRKWRAMAHLGRPSATAPATRRTATARRGRRGDPQRRAVPIEDYLGAALLSKKEFKFGNSFKKCDTPKETERYGFLRLSRYTRWGVARPSENAFFGV